jgi:hypothetical protein
MFHTRPKYTQITIRVTLCNANFVHCIVNNMDDISFTHFEYERHVRSSDYGVYISLLSKAEMSNDKM